MCLLVPACAAVLLAQADDPIDAIVAAHMKAQRIPGVAVAIVRRGEVVASKGYGLANVEHEVPVTDDTIFQSGSRRQAVHGGGGHAAGRGRQAGARPIR